MAKTHTAPWDYQQNTPVIFGDELNAMNERKERLAYVRSQLTDIIGPRAYRQFESSLPIYEQTNTQALIDAICNELDRYECSCRPDGNACRGCQTIFQARQDCNYQPDEHLEAAYADKTEIDF